MPTQPSLKAIVFDIDGTLAPGVSWLDLTKGLGGSVAEHKRIFQEYLAKAISYPESKRQLLGMWQATGNATLETMQQLFEARPLAADALATVQALSGQYKLCIITGSVDVYAKVTAKKLGIPDYYANTWLDWDRQGNLTDYHYVYDQAERKRQQFVSFCAKHNLQPEECAAVGDSANDRAIFEACKHGIMIAQADPPAELAPYAWRTIKTLSELPSLLAQ